MSFLSSRLAQAELQSRAEHAASMSASAARHTIPHETIERPAPRPLQWAVSGSAAARLFQVVDSEFVFHADLQLPKNEFEYFDLTENVWMAVRFIG